MEDQYPELTKKDEHAAQRLMDRYAILYTSKMKGRIHKAINDGTAIFLGDGVNCKFWQVEIQGQDVYLVQGIKKGKILTFVTKSQVQYNPSDGLLHCSAEPRRCKKLRKYQKKLYKKLKKGRTYVSPQEWKKMERLAKK